MPQKFGFFLCQNYVSDKIFSGYQPRHMSALNRRFEDCLGYHHQGSDTNNKNRETVRFLHQEVRRHQISDDDDDDDDDD
jgi:hypothetical protein